MAEPKVGANRGNAGKGRPKGSANKTTSIAKNVIASAAERIGGEDRLVAWVQSDPENEKIFWQTIYLKLLPLQVSGDADNPLTVIERRIVKAGN